MAHLDLELQSVLSDSIASAPLQTDANAADTPPGRIEDPEPICGRLPSGVGRGRWGLLRMCSGLEPGGRLLEPRPLLKKQGAAVATMDDFGPLKFNGGLGRSYLLRYAAG